MTTDQFNAYVKTYRLDSFPSAYDLVYSEFEGLGYNTKHSNYFAEYASDIVRTLRQNCWNSYCNYEKKFSSSMLKKLASEIPSINQLHGVDAVAEFVENYPDHIYNLSLSNTQSRRSRAGKEFEAIIELILIGADIPLDSQGSIGKSTFDDMGLQKLVDLVIPSVVYYRKDKRRSVLISAKTTLRERWQEVPEEKQRTGADRMYLFTLDESISEKVLKNLVEASIYIVTTSFIKESRYKNDVRVLTFEDLIRECQNLQLDWNRAVYSKTERDQLAYNLKKQMGEHASHPFVHEYYKRKLAEL